LVAEKQFRRVQGHKQIPTLLRELEALVPSQSEVFVVCQSVRFYSHVICPV
jgi:hypothetical protein